jgi:hypothetical protein
MGFALKRIEICIKLLRAMTSAGVQTKKSPGWPGFLGCRSSETSGGCLRLGGQGLNGRHDLFDVTGNLQAPPFGAQDALRVDQEG